MSQMLDMHVLDIQKQPECILSCYEMQIRNSGKHIISRESAHSRPVTGFQPSLAAPVERKRGLIRPQIFSQRDCKRAFDWDALREVRMVDFDRNLACGSEFRKAGGVVSERKSNKLDSAYLVG